MSSLIRHIAMRAEDTEKLAKFYEAAFGTVEVKREIRPEGDLAIYVTDGYITMAILPARGGKEGLDHIGFEIDDEGFGAQKLPEPRPANRPYAQKRLYDPVGTGVDLAGPGNFAREAS
jgi:catechol 2,3-dioxygenase-like lactoylglutathione lyase family enzyme